MNILEKMEADRLERVRKENERAERVEAETQKLPGEVKELVESYFVWPANPAPFHSALTNKENLVNYLLEVQGEEETDKTKKQDSKFIEEIWIKDKLNGPGPFPLNAIKEMRKTKKREQNTNRFYLENLELF